MATTFSDHGTLVADTVTTVTLTEPGTTLLVINKSATDTIYYTFGAGATNPTVAGDDTYCCPPGAGKRHTQGFFATLIVKLISSGTPAFSVET